MSKAFVQTQWINVKKKKRPKYNLKSRITSALRRVWYFSPPRRQVIKEAKARGNTCAVCNEPSSKLQVDHKISVVPETGFDNWQSYIIRLYCPVEDLQAVCIPCHKQITKQSRLKRKSKP